MRRMRQLADTVVDFWLQTRTKKLVWRQSHSEQLNQIDSAKTLAQDALAAELKKRSLQLEHELSLLRTTHETELNKHKIKCKQELKDYREYLQALDQLKEAIQASYESMPSAVAFTIHHHAKQLLNSMWDAQAGEDKLQKELRLIQFMSSIQADMQRARIGNAEENLPLQTLKLLEDQGIKELEFKRF